MQLPKHSEVKLLFLIYLQTFNSVLRVIGIKYDTYREYINKAVWQPGDWVKQ